MPAVYVTEQGALVGIKRERLEIRKGDDVLTSVRLADTDRLVLYGAVHLTSKAIRMLLRQRIETIFLTRSGRLLGRLTGPLGPDAELRWTQYQRLADEPFARQTARILVRGKLVNQRHLLLRYQRTRKDEQVAEALLGIRRMLRLLDEADTLDALRGYEGQAAATYFPAYGRLLKAPGIVFTQRLRRPPPDPVNILLSFGYTLLMSQVLGAVEAAGLDPYFGAFHAPAYNRPSLALDLMEELRPVVVDTTVLRAFNKRIVTPADFVPAGDEDAPVEEVWEAEEQDREPEPPPPRRKLLLTPEGSKKWFTLFERRMGEQAWYAPAACRLTYRQIIRKQAYAFVRHLRGEATYQPHELSP